MLLLWRTQAKDPTRGYATTFVRQLEDCLGIAWERGVKIVANAGGLNPAGCAAAVREIAHRLGLRVNVALRRGRRPAAPPGRARRGRRGAARRRRSPPTPTSAAGASRPRSTAARRSSSPAGSPTPRSSSDRPPGGTAGTRDDYDALAGALVTGHVLECGAQATGGNYSFFTEVPGIEHLGFPLAEIASDGTRGHHQARGHRRAGRRRHRHRAAALRDRRPHYLNPDVTADFSHDRADRGRPRPGPDLRREGHRAAGDHEGLRQHPRRLPQLDDVPADRARHRGEGRPGHAPARAGRSTASRRSSGTRRAPTTTTRRPTSRRSPG